MTFVKSQLILPTHKMALKSTHPTSHATDSKRRQFKITDPMEIHCLSSKLKIFESIKRQHRIMNKLPDGGRKILVMIQQLEEQLYVSKPKTNQKNGKKQIKKSSKKEKRLNPMQDISNTFQELFGVWILFIRAHCSIICYLLLFTCYLFLFLFSHVECFDIIYYLSLLFVTCCYLHVICSCFYSDMLNTLIIHFLLHLNLLCSCLDID